MKATTLEQLESAIEDVRDTVRQLLETAVDGGDVDDETRLIELERHLNHALDTCDEWWQ